MKAIVIGGTGMVGKQLLKQLTENDTYSDVVSLVRRPGNLSHAKLKEEVINFDRLNDYAGLINGDVLYSTLGTTIAQAKTKEAQFKVDYTYQLSVAEIAAANGITSYVLVSSAGASSTSTLFYPNMKGKLDDAVRKLPFNVISILRPGQLDGIREEKRVTEKISLSVMYFLNRFGLLKRYKPIQAHEVAHAMINAAAQKKSATYTLSEVFDLAK